MSYGKKNANPQKHEEKKSANLKLFFVEVEFRRFRADFWPKFCVENVDIP